MKKMGAKFLAVAAAAAFVGACTEDRPSERASASSQRAQSLESIDAHTLTLQTPAGMNPLQTALGAIESLQVHDRAQVVRPGNGFAPISNVGSSLTKVGVDGRAGELISEAGVQLRERSSITGSVTSGAGVTQWPDSVVTGSVTESADLSPSNVLSWEVTFAPSDESVIVYGGQAASPTPGAYSAMRAFSGSHVTLTSGDYFVGDLQIEPQATVSLDTSDGPIVMYVRSSFTYRGDVVGVTGNPAKNFLLGYLGTTPLVIERPWNGTLVAPESAVRLGVGGTPHSGAILAATHLEVDPDVQLIHAPFEHWGHVFPPTPSVECVAEKWDGYWVAKLSYENELEQTVEIPVGPENQPNPQPADRPWPTEFKPGKHSFWTPLGASTFSWRLGDTEVVATSDLPRCSADDYTPVTVLDGLDPVHPSHPAAAALARQQADVQSFVRLIPNSASNTVPGSSAPPVAPPLAQGGTPTPTAAPGLLPVVIHWKDFYHGQTSYDTLTALVTVNGVTQTETLPSCGGFGQGCLTNGVWDLDWAPSFHHVPQGTAAQVHIEMREGSAVRHSYDFTIDPGTGVAHGDAAECSGPRPAWASCFDHYSDHSVDLCTRWRGQFIDAGYGEGVANSSEPQVMAAAHAFSALYRSDQTEPVWSGYLDGDGCIPEDERPFASSLAFLVEPVSEPAILTFVTRPQFCRYTPGLPRPRNEQECLDGVNSGTIATKILHVPTSLRSYDPATGAVGVIDEQAKLAGSMLTEHESSLDMRGLATQFTFQGIIRPPRNFRIRLNVSGNDEVSRVAFATSRLLSMPDGVTTTGAYTLFANDACPTENSETAGDSCVSPVTNFLYIGTTRQGQDERWSQSRWKYIIAHEVGHMLQKNEHRGMPLLQYAFNDEGEPGSSEGEGTLFDPPDTNPMCRCDHVESANRWHCLQSLETSSSAQAEGFAHFLASKMWNSDGTSCVFNYYKEFADDECISEECRVYQPPPPSPTDQLVKNLPPVAVSCDSPHLWRNTFCGDIAEFGTEIDWMAFFWRVNMTTQNRATMQDIRAIYREAFDRAPYNDVDWVNLEASASATLGVGNPRFAHLQETGNETGVDLDTSRP